jgi:hypothetical protein
MDLYERILKEREEEERRRGRPLGPYHGMDSIVLDRKLGNPSANQSGYSGDLHRLYRYVHSGIRSLGGGYRFQHLKRRYPTEYAELRAERDGEYYEQRKMFVEA